MKSGLLLKINLLVQIGAGGDRRNVMLYNNPSKNKRGS